LDVTVFYWLVLKEATNIYAHLTVIITTKVSEGAADIKGVKAVCNTEIGREVSVPPNSLATLWFHWCWADMICWKSTVILLFSRFTSERKNDSSLEQVIASSDDTAAACHDCSDVPQHTPHAASQNKVAFPSPNFRFFMYSLIH